MPEEKFLETILNVGANVTSGGVLIFIGYFLYRNIPRWIDAYFVQMKQITDSHHSEIKDVTSVFRQEQKIEREMCERHHDHIATMLEHSNQQNVQAIEKIGTQLNDHHSKMVDQIQKLS